MAERSIAAVLKTVEPRGSGGSNPSLSANQNPWWRQRTCPLPFSFEASPTSQQTGAGPPAAAQGKTSEATSTPKTPPRQKSSDIIPTISRDTCSLTFRAPSPYPSPKGGFAHDRGCGAKHVDPENGAPSSWGKSRSDVTEAKRTKNQIKINEI